MLTKGMERNIEIFLDDPSGVMLLHYCLGSEKSYIKYAIGPKVNKDNGVDEE